MYPTIIVNGYKTRNLYTEEKLWGKQRNGRPHSCYARLHDDKRIGERKWTARLTLAGSLLED